MAAHDPNGGLGHSADEIRREEIKKVDLHLENVLRIMNEVQQNINGMREFITRQLAEYQPQELGKTLIELTIRNIKLFLITHVLSGMEEAIRQRNSDLEVFQGSLQQSLSFLAICQISEKNKELLYNQDLKKMRMKSNCKTDWERKFMDKYFQRLLLSMEEMRLEEQSTHSLLTELKNKAEILRRRIEAGKRELVFLLRQTDTLRRWIEQERLAVAQELRRRTSEIAGEDNILQQGQEVATIASVMLILAAIAAALDTRPSRQEEAEEANGSAEEEKFKERSSKR